jgi:DNA-binding MarR family transcriptional regulator
MAKTKKTTKKVSRNEGYVKAFYEIVKKSEGLYLTTKNARFSDTELRLIAEISSAAYENKRLISTQLANRLGVTRSAISQMVQNMEKKGVVKRVADDVDKKIAYVELTEETYAIYEKEWKLCVQFAGQCVKKFGEDKFEQMCELFNEFFVILETERAEVMAKLK